MSELDEAILRRIRQITCKEDRPFTFKDLLKFKVDGIEHKMEYGTFRNKIKKLIDCGIVELYCRSSIAFYTLKGHKFRKDVPRGGTVGLMSCNPRSSNYNSSKRSISEMIESLPLDKRSIHNIRLKFKVPDICNTLKNNNTLHVNSGNKGIYIPTFTRDNISIQITVHFRDTIEIILGCSLNPITLDNNGLLKLSTMLVRIEEYLASLLNSCFPLVAPNCNTYVPFIPSYKKWIITMWHLGRDSLTQYYGKMFNIEVEQAHGVISRIYSKQWKNKKKIRMEVQEYPNKSIEQLIQQRIYAYE